MTKERSGGTTSEDDPSLDPETNWTQVSQRNFDPAGDEELTTTVVFAIANARDVDPREVNSPPLYECVDAPALQNSLFGSAVAGGSRQGTGTVEFRYAEFLVKIRSDGWIQVFEPADSRSP